VAEGKKEAGNHNEWEVTVRESQIKDPSYS
jgi:hypothetical protein